MSHLIVNTLLSSICRVKIGARWRQVDLNEYADADFGAWMGRKQPKINPLLDPTYCATWVQSVAQAKSVDYTWGGYMEDRSTLWRGHYMGKGFHTHYGIDLNVPAGTPVCCPVDYRIIEVFMDADQNGGWGERVIVETPRGYVVFAHLTFAPRDFVLGQWMDRGTCLGTVAPSKSNGGWYPHLHLQGLSSPHHGFDGYGRPSRAAMARHPNPLDLLRVSILI